jgi:hypothetical protein
MACFASSEYNPASRHGAVADFGRIVMGIRLSGTLLAAVTTAFVIAPGLSALAQFNPPSLGGTGQATGQGKSSTTNRMGGGGGTKAGGGVNRMGGGGGAKAGGAANRMGGGGGAKGAVTK